MWLKPLRRVVLTRGISNAGRTFIQVLNKRLSPGRYFLSPFKFNTHSATDQITVFRLDHQTVMLKPHSGAQWHRGTQQRRCILFNGPGLSVPLFTLAPL